MVRQVYEDYTPEQFEVWSILYSRQLEFLRGRVYAGYYEDLDQLGFSAEKIPRFDEMSPRLKEVAGWQLQVVDDFLPASEYLSLTAQRILPATSFLRSMDELDHCKRPDMFHDVFGHTPMLVNPSFRVYFQALSELALERVDDEQFIDRLGNFNKWVAEFGLIEEDGQVKAYGAGLLSSSGELDYALGDEPRRLPADARQMIFTPHIRAEYQAQYFVIESFEWLEGIVSELRVILAENSPKRRPDTSVLSTRIAPLPGMRLIEGDVRWHIEDHAPELFRALQEQLPEVADLSRELRTEIPVQVDWHFGDVGPVTRPDRHVRAFYLDLAKLLPGQQGSIAVKGSEVWADNFEELVNRLRLTWSIFTWSLGGPERHILDDICMMDQLERFPVAEGKPPNVHPLADAIEEAEICSAYQLAHIERYGEFAHVPFPLVACKWPDELRDHVYKIVEPWLSRKTKQIVEDQLQGGMGTFIYYYPTVPIRVMHLQIPDATTTAHGTTYADRFRQLGQATDIERAVDGWLRTATRMLALGWLPADPASLGRGNCLMPQNLVLDGGIVDLDSLREVHTINTRGELQFALQKSCRVLSQAIAWFFVGTSAGLERFERMYSDVYAFVWQAQRELLSREQLPDTVAEILAQDGGLTQQLHRYFGWSFDLGQFRPGDLEDKRFTSSPSERGST